ncbi:hypothetical protein EPUS_06820 [Endocarpon pusillum Z07020]|uniref:Uncharacterized protein n=1 Tax=Endocarpon pusillum (strain Z07020 / HMAS-L-300199) TaxID=1263415 RepID=U1GH41_ENDPU|nr:uncharacterized protein EPUS_06820 [Endocarpon pusillum Z07020]ERF71438.1 hypothetical protein EPUS_06820 [Endocarpon pusillum Z07020]
MKPGSRGPSGSPQSNPIGHHPAGKQSPRKRDRSEQPPLSTTTSSASSSFSSVDSPQTRCVSTRTGQYSCQKPNQATSRLHTGRSTGDDRKAPSSQIEPQTQTQREVAQAVSTFYLRQRELYNPLVGQQEEVSDNMPQPERNPQQSLPKLVPRSQQTSNPGAQNVAAPHIRDVRAEVQDPKGRKEIFERELQRLLTSKTETRKATDLSKTAEQSSRQAQGTCQTRGGMLPSRHANPVGTNTTRAPGQISAMGRNASSTRSGASSETYDPFGTLDTTEIEMMHELILKHKPSKDK